MVEYGEQPYFRAVLANCDNMARKAVSGGYIFHGMTPRTFQKWLADIVDGSKLIYLSLEDIVFVNVWNEWG